ncbi:hypothetical protein KPSA1_01147 [Pseudomonas syringae pv. actinidiae]|uniref:Uncharacterized protein n=1 Tax=Pseudomonas syringae pv. actinidiae TaxID=103796 RepID=A0A2V0Q6F2_PSESF|nr:hypothetical protein KPSA1_01147 [Pseudomonas syringae pv. actinidiae]
MSPKNGALISTILVPALRVGMHFWTLCVQHWNVRRGADL